MAQKIIIVADPGIDTAFAVALAVNDPGLEVLAIAATAGNVPSDQATRNVHVLVELIDPPRWPRIGASLPVEYELTQTHLHGADGLGGLNFPCARLHHPHPADKVICDAARQAPGEVALLVIGPATALARALDRDPELSRLLSRVVVVGGTWHEAGDASAVAEFHFWCDPPAARQVLNCGAPVTLLPLDVTRKLILSPAELGALPSPETRTGELLRKVVPLALAPTATVYGVEGVYLCDVVGLAAVARPGAFGTKAVAADVEVLGELTRGMSVFDTRWSTSARPNIDLATGVDLTMVRQYVQQVLGEARA